MSGQTEQEPSIEEILASIRQIISDDDETAPDDSAADVSMEEKEVKAAPEPVAPPPVKSAKAEPEKKAEPVSKPIPAAKAEMVEDDDVLDLKDPLPAPMERPVIDLEDALEEEDEKEFISSLDEEDEDHVIVSKDADMEEEYDMPALAPEESIITAPAPSAFALDKDDESILGEAARSAALSGFTKLANTMPLERGTTPQATAGGLTLEDILRDMLNPLLRSWLDENLPGIIEKLVQKELDKLARRASDD